MRQELIDFNDLLKRNKNAIGVIECEGKITAAVTGKATGDFLIEAIEEAIKDSLDYEDVALTNVVPGDYGYSLDLTFSYVQDKEERTESYSITHTILY